LAKNITNSLTVPQNPDFSLHNTLPMNLLIMKGPYLTGLLWNAAIRFITANKQSGNLTTRHDLELQTNVWKCRKLSTTL